MQTHNNSQRNGQRNHTCGGIAVPAPILGVIDKSNKCPRNSREVFKIRIK